MLAVRLSWNTRFPRTAPRCSDAPPREPESSTPNTHPTGTNKSRLCALPANVLTCYRTFTSRKLCNTMGQMLQQPDSNNHAAAPFPTLFVQATATSVVPKAHLSQKHGGSSGHTQQRQLLKIQDGEAGMYNQETRTVLQAGTCQRVRSRLHPPP